MEWLLRSQSFLPPLTPYSLPARASSRHSGLTAQWEQIRIAISSFDWSKKISLSIPTHAALSRHPFRVFSLSGGGQLTKMWMKIKDLNHIFFPTLRGFCPQPVNNFGVALNPESPPVYFARRFQEDY